MNVFPMKTDKVTEKGDVVNFIDQFVPHLDEESVLVITSKVISILEGNVVPTANNNKEDLIAKEADTFIPAASSRYHVTLSIKSHTLIANSGIDESNGNDSYILWPKNPFQTAQLIWKHLQKRDGIQNVGVIISDSRITPLRWGTTGVGLAWCGFEPLKNYIGTPDIFGRKLEFTKGSVLDGLAATAVLVMGEGNEQTPLALITKATFVDFKAKPPTKEDIKALQIEPEDDLFAPLLTSSLWKKKDK